MKRIIRTAIFFTVYCLVLFCGSSFPQPEWWREADFDVPRKESVVKQYFFAVDEFLKPAYKAKGAEGEALLKKSIIAMTRLIEWFREERDMPTACVAQFQIAEAYKRLGDTARAKEAYKKCLDYKRYAKDPPEDMADTTILTIIRSSNEELGGLR
jgi:tetratricopeptide (TPR) repeat protein